MHCNKRENRKKKAEERRYVDYYGQATVNHVMHKTWCIAPFSKLHIWSEIFEISLLAEERSAN